MQTNMAFLLPPVVVVKRSLKECRFAACILYSKCDLKFKL